MSNPLTDPPTAVVPFDQFAPDLATLSAQAYADAVAVLDTTPLFPVAIFNIQGQRNLNSFLSIDYTRAYAVMPFSCLTNVALHYKLDAGATASPYDDQYVAVWFLDPNGSVRYRANVKQGASTRGVVALPAGVCLMVMKLTRVSDFKTLAPIQLALSAAVQPQG